MSEDRLDQIVNSLIQNYQLTSKSRRFDNLSFEKCPAIVKSIRTKQDAKKHLFELIEKKDQYTHKVYRLLNESIPKNDEYSPYETNEGTPTLNPAYITNRYLAEKYVRNLIRNEAKSHEISQIKKKHLQFHEDMKTKRGNIIKHYRHLKDELNAPNVGLTKLASLNSSIKDNKILAIERDLKEELNKFDTGMISDMKKLMVESEERLKLLKVPFFALSPDYTYPDLKKDKEFMIDLLKGLVD